MPLSCNSSRNEEKPTFMLVCLTASTFKILFCPRVELVILLSGLIFTLRIHDWQLRLWDFNNIQKWIKEILILQKYLSLLCESITFQVLRIKNKNKTILHFDVYQPISPTLWLLTFWLFFFWLIFRNLCSKFGQHGLCSSSSSYLLLFLTLWIRCLDLKTAGCSHALSLHSVQHSLTFSQLYALCLI